MNRLTANLVKAQPVLIGAMQRAELRYMFPSTYLSIKAQSPIMLENYEVLRKREDRPIEINYAKRQKRSTVQADRDTTFSFDKGDTGTLTPSWATYKDGFDMSLKQADTSVMNWEKQFADEFNDVFSNFMEDFEELASEFLLNNRTEINVASAEGTFNTTQHVFEIPLTRENRVVQIMKTAMQANAYNTPINIYCDSTMYNKCEFIAAQGITNATNLSFQFGNATFIHSFKLNELVAAFANPYTEGFALCVPVNTVACLPWIPMQNRKGISSKVAELGSILCPIDNEAFAVAEVEKFDDDSSRNGSKQDIIYSYEVSRDVTFVKAPLSTSGASTIFAFGLISNP